MKRHLNLTLSLKSKSVCGTGGTNDRQVESPIHIELRLLNTSCNSVMLEFSCKATLDSALSSMLVLWNPTFKPSMSGMDQQYFVMFTYLSTIHTPCA